MCRVWRKGDEEDMVKVQSPVNDEGSDEDENSQDGQNSTNHVADVKSLPWDRQRRC